MKKFILMLVFIATSFTMASAADYDYLTVLMSDGTEQSFTASGLSITFSDGYMVVNENGTSTSLSLATLSKMYFSTTATAIRDINTTDADVLIKGDFYDLQGRKVLSDQAIATAASQLPKGIYVVRKGNRSVKITVK